MTAPTARRRLPISRDLTRYGLVGLSGVAVDLSVLAVLHEVVGMHLLLANVLSFSCAVASNYLLNSAWTFRHRTRRSHYTGGALFLLAALVGLAISEAGLWALTAGLSVFYVWAKLALVAVVFAWNYAFNNAITFRHQALPAAAAPPRYPRAP